MLAWCDSGSDILMFRCVLNVLIDDSAYNNASMYFYPKNMYIV